MIAPITLGDLVTSALSISGRATLGEVARLFERQPEVDTVAVRGGPRPRSVVRTRFLDQLHKRFGYSLCEKRPVVLLAEEALQVEASVHPATVLPLALRRAPEKVRDDVMVVSSGRFEGFVPMRSLIASCRGGAGMPKGSNVLLIDHDPAILDRARQLLEAGGLRTMVYGLPSERTGFVVPEPPDLVLVNPSLPFLPSGELVKLIRQTPSLRDLPLVLFSWNDDATLRRLVRETGAAGYVTKASLGPGFAGKVRAFMTARPAGAVPALSHARHAVVTGPD